MKSLEYWIWLNSIPGVGAVRFRELTGFFGSPEDVWKASLKNSDNVPFAGKKYWSCVINKAYKDNLNVIFKLLEKHNIKVITLDSKEYPVNLKNIFDPPPVLFVKGELKESDRLAVAVVGCRNPTTYGERIAEGIGYQLAKNGLMVVSGLARGIDSAAHRGALKAKGRTAAILACGVDSVYPPENQKMSEKIIEAGVVISDYTPGTLPLAVNFPPRNRIISGLSLGTVVVEAGKRSGALITSDFALEQNREIFAVPGNIDSSESAGTNQLIKDGAKLVTCIQDILDELQLPDNINIKVKTEGAACVGNTENDKSGKAYDNKNSEFKGPNLKRRLDFGSLDKDEEKILSVIDEHHAHFDKIAERSGLDIKTVSSLLVMMELKGIIRQLPGKNYCINEL